MMEQIHQKLEKLSSVGEYSLSLSMFLFHLIKVCI